MATEDRILSANPVLARRLAKEWSQAELAERVGISRAAVSAIEGERLSPSVATALALDLSATPSATDTGATYLKTSSKLGNLSVQRDPANGNSCLIRPFGPLTLKPPQPPGVNPAFTRQFPPDQLAVAHLQGEEDTREAGGGSMGGDV